MLMSTRKRVTNIVILKTQEKTTFENIIVHCIKVISKNVENCAIPARNDFRIDQETEK
jgi:hypothetical protein